MALFFEALRGHSRKASFRNRTCGVDSPKIQQKIRTIVHKLVVP
jgi:hypothetical protein